MPACPSCQRPVATTRPTCLYCGAELPAEAVSAAQDAARRIAGAPTEAALESPAAEPAPEAAPRFLLVVDLTGQGVTDLARLLELPAYEAGQRERQGGLQLHRVGDEDAVRAEVA